MKKILSICTLLFCIISSGQVKKQTLLKETIGTTNLEYIKSTDIEINKISYLVYLSFQNQKYSSITDFKIIGFYDQESINVLIKDLTGAQKQMLLNEKVSVKWNKSNYNLDLYDFSPNLYLSSTKGVSGYTTLNSKQVGNLISNLSKIDFGKDTLLIKN